MSNMTFDYEEKKIIDTYQFLIDRHIEMIGSGKKLEKLEAKIKNIVAKADEKTGSIDKKIFSEKLDVLRHLFLSRSSVRKILIGARNDLMAADKKKGLLEKKESKQRMISIRAVKRFNTMDKNYNKYTTDTNEIETSASKYISGKPKFYSIHKQVSEFEFSELKEDLEVVIGDGKDVDDQRVSSIVKSAQTKLKNAGKQKVILEKKMMNQNKLLQKLQDALKIATERRSVLYKFFIDGKVQYRVLKKISSQVVDNINNFLSDPSKFRVIPEITIANLKNENNESSDEKSGGMYYDNDMYGGKEIQTRMHKYSASVASLKSKLSKFVDGIDKTENKDKALVNSIDIYNNMLNKLKGASKEVRSYIKAAKQIDELLKEGALHVIEIIKKWNKDQEDVNKRDIQDLESESLKEVARETGNDKQTSDDQTSDDESSQSAGWFY